MSEIDPSGRHFWAVVVGDAVRAAETAWRSERSARLCAWASILAAVASSVGAVVSWVAR